MSPAIRFQNVAVGYRRIAARVPSVKESFVMRCGGLKRRVENFWALNGVNLEAEPGDLVGIIGRNGAGKSTLLKVVAGIIKPVRGKVEVHGRVIPLIELAAGFDVELTGRENIFLNGSLLGYSNKQIASVFDSIVEFAELTNSIENPLRTYSTGMIARLGFAIATNLEPDVLVVDEVLAVGDINFQEKCANRVADFRRKGVTIMLVSHDRDQVRSICNKTLLLDQGQVLAFGPPDGVIARYEALLANHPA